jgi:malate/lactate dehydrogenase
LDHREHGSHIGPDAIRPVTPIEPRNEIVNAAARVKGGSDGVSLSTLAPIVEGVVQVIESLLVDRRSVMTVSCEDPNDHDRLYYSMPCVVGRAGILERHEVALNLEGREALSAGVEATRRMLRARGDLE